MRSLLIGAFGAIALVAPVSLPAAVPAPAVTTFTLPNGLVGVVIEDHRAPVVTQMIWFKVGAADEPAGQSGNAHFLEHLMFKATGKLADGEFSRIVAENGGEENAFTTADYTAYFQRVAADRLGLVMGLEADRMVNLAPGPDTVPSERDVVIEERRQRIGNSPDALFHEQMRAALYLNHPYGNPVIGWPDEMTQFTREQALAFYRKYYAPNNAILVVSGDVEPEEVERLAETHFGPIPASDAVPPRVRPQEPSPIAERRVIMHDPRVAEPYLSRFYLAPQRRPGDQADAAALTVLAALLGDSGLTSVMAQKLELGDGIAVSSGASYRGVAVDPVAFNLYVVPKPGISLEDAEAGLDELIDEFVEIGPDLEQLERVKTRVRASEIYDLDSQQGQARRVGAALATGLTLEDVEAWPGLLQEVSAEEVRSAARALFQPEASVTGWLMSEDGE